jgi:predicted TPR repeat methyltransferase
LGLFLDAQRSWLNVLDVEPDNLEARHMLAALTNEPVRTVPDGYSAQLFDWFAPRYDRLLSGPLDYRGAQETLSLLREVEPNRDAFRAFADLGCGTGVVGESVGEYYRIDREVGVDVSRKMIEVARSKGVYDEFVRRDAQEYLTAHPDSFDLITAVDLFINIGELETLMPAIAGGVKPGGIVVYTIETLASGKYKLMATGRFAHALTYIEDLARGAGLVPVKAKPVTLRFEKSRPVSGVVGALRRASA